MQQLTAAGNEAVQSLAQRYGVSVDAVTTLLVAVSNGGGTMAQFYHPELGGGGQWMQGGMTMVGDMFNSRLQGTVNGLCSELSTLLSQQQVFAAPPARAGGGAPLPANRWWPEELGSPSASGGQNDSRYAYFPSARRLVIDRAGRVTVYDTLDHQIGGVQQQQGGAYGTLTFSSQFGTFSVDSLPVVSPEPARRRPAAEPAAPAYAAAESHSTATGGGAPAPSHVSSADAAPQSGKEILDALERLGQLHQKGIISDGEFRTKKAELLSRL